jgi:hypothetical protein
MAYDFDFGLHRVARLFWQDKFFLTVLAFFALVLPGYCSAETAWQANGVPICAAANNQQSPQVISDYKGGYILVWEDWRGAFGGAYAQLIDNSGQPKWSLDGIAVGNNIGSPLPNINAISDGQNGAIVTWQNNPSGVYIQSFNNSGSLLWPPGIKLNTQNVVVPSVPIPSIVPDGMGGAIVIFQCNTDGSHYKGLFAQHVNNSGVIQWAPNGVTICADPIFEPIQRLDDPWIISDGQNGAIVAWSDPLKNGGDIYAQRVNSFGNTLWANNGIPICSASGSQRGAVVISDGQGGAVFAWQDFRNGHYNIFAQKVNGSGVKQWESSGVTVCSNAYSQSQLGIISDGSTGVIISWQDTRSTKSIYAQRLDSSGAVLWTSNGILVCDSGACDYPVIAADSQGGGAIVSWQDSRSGNYDIYSQRINAQGNPLWTNNGALVCNATGDQTSPAICYDSQYGAVIGWTDERNGTTNKEIFAQHLLTLKPEVSAIYPNYVLAGGMRNFSILGSNFSLATAVKLVKSGQADLYGLNMNKPNGSQIDINFDLTSAVLGLWSIMVIDSSGQSSNANVSLTISDKTPTPTVTPTVTVTPTMTSSTPLPQTPTVTPYSWSEPMRVACGPNPVRGSVAHLNIFTRQGADVEAGIFTPSGRAVNTFRYNYATAGRHIEDIFVGDLANGIYMVQVKAKNADGSENRVVYKMALIK